MYILNWLLIIIIDSLTSEVPENLSTDLYVAASAVGTALGSMVEQVAATQEGKDNVYSALLKWY